MSYDFSELSIVIPWRPGSDSSRQRIFDWVFERYRLLFPGAEIVIADDGSEEFNRSTFINHGVEQATGEFLLIADADTVSFPVWIDEAIKEIKLGAPWVIPYSEDGYVDTDKRGGRKILSCPPDKDIDPYSVTFQDRLKSWSGQVVIRRDDFWKVGGFDPRFKGWGYEDNAFVECCDTILGPHERLTSGYTIHIWHPAPVETTWDQPNIEMNRALYAHYHLKSGDRDAMLKFVGAQ